MVIKLIFSTLFVFFFSFKFCYCMAVEIIESNEIGNGTGKIVGGQIVEIEAVPYIVSITKSGQKWCGGSIISNQWILTAAHCFENTDPTIYKVRVGSSRATRGGTVFDVDKIFNHDQYNSVNNDYDATLLKLKKTIRIGDRQQTIKLASANKAIADDTVVITSGWGDTRNDKEQTEFLRSVEVLTVNQVSCKETYDEKNTPETPYEVTDNMLCAAVTGGGKDSCQVNEN